MSLRLKEQPEPATPASGYAEFYVDVADDHVKVKDDTGTVYDLQNLADAITDLTGDVTAVGPGITPATVNSVGGVSAASIAYAVTDVAAATALNTPSTIVKRDGSGNFAAGTITAALSGNATTATTSVNFSGSLAGDVTGTQGATVLAASGVTPGTYTKVTVDAKGRTTVGATATLASADFANQGTTSTVLHGNAAGNPSFGAVVLTTEVSGVLPIANGGTNSGTALSNNRVMQSSGGAVVEAAAITAARALISDANGIPTHSATTATELGYVSGVTSSIQTQLNSKQTAFPLVVVTGDVTLTANAIHLVSSAAARNLTLPAHVAGQRIYIKDSTGSNGTNNFTLIRTGGGNIDGLAASRLLQTDWGSWHLVDDGVDWFLV